MRRSPRFVVALVAWELALSGCATSRSEAPTSSPDLPRFGFPGLKGKTLAISVLDHRAERAESVRWCNTVEEDITRAMQDAGVTVSARGDHLLEIRLNALRSDFQNREWQGCAQITAVASGPTLPERKVVEARQCVTKANMSGYATADEVLEQAYHDTLAQLLSSIDLQVQ